MKAFLKLATVAAAFAFAFACGSATDTSKNTNIPANDQTASRQTPLPKPTLDEAAMGAKVFEANCTICHQASGTGGKVTVEGRTLKVHDLTSDHVKNHDDAAIIKDIMEGAEDDGMPAFKDKLSEGELRAVVAYIRQLQKGIVTPPVANKAQPQ